MGDFRESRRYGNSAAAVPREILPQSGMVSGARGGFSSTGASLLPEDLPARRVTEPQRYGETVLLNGILGAGVNRLVLQQPATTRVYMMIQNNDATDDLWANFGAAAAVNLGFRLFAGQSVLFDAFVPQDEINFFSVAAVPFVLHYANKAL